MCPNALHYFSVIIASSHAAKLLMSTIQYKQVERHTHTHTHTQHTHTHTTHTHTDDPARFDFTHKKFPPTPALITANTSDCLRKSF